MVPFQELKSALGGKRGRVAVRILSMRLSPSSVSNCCTHSRSRPWVGGISGGSQGAYSVALSGGYDDDIDLGYAL